MTDNSYETRLKEAKQMFERGVEMSAIESKLKSVDVEPGTLSVIMEQLAILKKARWRKTGTICVAIGCFLLVFGFILTLILFNTGTSISIALYGPTLIGIILLMVGMVIILG